MAQDSLHKAQHLFDRLEALKTDKASKIRERKEGLEQIARYNEIQAEAQKLRESRKGIEKDFDEQNNGLVTDIESLKTKIESTQFSLTNAMLEIVKDGGDASIMKRTKSGEMKKMRFEFKVNFSQTTLGL